MSLRLYPVRLSLATALALLSGVTAAARAQTVPAPSATAPSVTAPSASAQPAAARTKGAAASQGTVSAAAPVIADGPLKSSAGVLVDQVVAIVNGDLVLESDVQEEQHFAAFQLYTAGNFSRDTVIERLIDRDLILQQAKLQPDDAVTRDDALKQLNALRKEIPDCKQDHCETEAGWNGFIHAQGFTMEELVTRWQERMQVLKFIEVRFRSGLQISPAEIQTYYEKTLLPQYAKLHAPAPKLAVISDRVQEILLTNQVSNLLGDWLKTLKAEGSVRVIRPGEVQP